MKYLRYLQYVTKHKWYVFLVCCKLGIPWLGIIHDWSKFLPGEFLGYTRYFYGDALNCDAAWLPHQKRNKHHWQFYVLLGDDGETKCLPMPDKYRREMVADLRGAERSIIGGASAADYYLKVKDKMQLHPDTRTWLEKELGMLDGLGVRWSSTQP